MKAHRLRVIYSSIKCICLKFGGLLIFLIQDVHVHLPGRTGGPDAVWNVSGSGVTDGTICQKSAVVVFQFMSSDVPKSTSVNSNKLKCDVLFLLTLQKKRLPVKIEKGTGGMSDVDISWIPQETLNVMSKFTHVTEQELSKMPQGH